MTDPVRSRTSAVDTVREVLGELNHGGPRLVTFTRGLALGALVGAAIAGMAMLDRRARRGGSGEPSVPPGDSQTTDQPAS